MYACMHECMQRRMHALCLLPLLLLLMLSVPLSTVTACVSYLADQCPQSSTGVASMQAAAASFETGHVSRTGVVPAGPTTMLPHWADLMTRVAQSVSTNRPRLERVVLVHFFTNKTAESRHDQY